MQDEQPNPLKESGQKSGEFDKYLAEPGVESRPTSLLRALLVREIVSPHSRPILSGRIEGRYLVQYVVEFSADKTIFQPQALISQSFLSVNSRVAGEWGLV